MTTHSTGRGGNGAALQLFFSVYPFLIRTVVLCAVNATELSEQLADARLSTKSHLGAPGLGPDLRDDVSKQPKCQRCSCDQGHILESPSQLSDRSVGSESPRPSSQSEVKSAGGTTSEQVSIHATIDTVIFDVNIDNDTQSEFSQESHTGIITMISEFISESPMEATDIRSDDMSSNSKTSNTVCNVENSQPLLLDMNNESLTEPMLNRVVQKEQGTENETNLSNV